MTTWYPTLLHHLFIEIPRETITHGVLVCQQTLINNKLGRIYGYFYQPETIYDYIQALTPTNRCMFEVILGERQQKPHFDIDVEHTPDNLAVAQQVINSVVQSLLTLNVDVRSIRLYQSTSADKPKASYHLVVVDRYCLNNNQAKAVWIYCHNRLPANLKAYLDAKVYSPTQQFRFIGNAKLGKDNYKTLVKEWAYGDITVAGFHPYSAEAQFLESLVSIIPDDAVLIQCPTEAIPAKTISAFEQTTLSPDMIDGAMELLQLYPFLPDHANFDRVVNNLILLHRTKPSLCPICNRSEAHTGNNPFLAFKQVGINCWKVYYYCRSQHANNQGLYLGEVESTLELDDEVVVETTLESGLKLISKYSAEAPIITGEIIKKASRDFGMQKALGLLNK